MARAIRPALPTSSMDLFQSAFRSLRAHAALSGVVHDVVLELVPKPVAGQGDAKRLPRSLMRRGQGFGQCLAVVGQACLRPRQRVPVSAVNSATAASRDVTTDSAGLYTISNLVPGAYEIRVSATGFSTSVQSGLTVAVGQQLQLNFSLKVGNTSTTVQVTEAAPQIDLTSSALSGQVESETVRELPLNGRDWTSLAVLQPGVKPIETQMAFATSARGNRGFGGELTVSGQRSTFNNYRIDGITVSDYAMSSPGNVIGVVLGVDSIQEFQVLTGGFPAEYGRATGGVVNAITPPGLSMSRSAPRTATKRSSLK